MPLYFLSYCTKPSPQDVLVQLTIPHPTPLTSSNLQENLFYYFNGSLFHPNADFLITHTHRFIVSSPIDSRLTSTPPCPTPALVSNIYNVLISNPFPQFPFSFNHIPLSLTSQITTHARYISLPCMVFECRLNIRNQPVSTSIPFPSPFCNSATTETHRHFGKILIDIFKILFKTGWHYNKWSIQIYFLHI